MWCLVTYEPCWVLKDKCGKKDLDEMGRLSLIGSTVMCELKGLLWSLPSHIKVVFNDKKDYGVVICEKGFTTMSDIKLQSLKLLVLHWLGLWLVIKLHHSGLVCLICMHVYIVASNKTLRNKRMSNKPKFWWRKLNS